MIMMIMMIIMMIMMMVFCQGTICSSLTVGRITREMKIIWLTS